MPLAGRPFLTFMLDWLRGPRRRRRRALLRLPLRRRRARARATSTAAWACPTSTRTEPLGTAGPVRLALDLGLLDARVLVLNGDVLTDLDLATQLAWHEARGASATLALVAVEDTASYGVVPTTADGRGRGLPREERRPRAHRTASTRARTCSSARWSSASPRAGRLVRARGLPGARGRGAVRLPRRGLLDRHRHARALPAGHAGTC